MSYVVRSLGIVSQGESWGACYAQDLYSPSNVYVKRETEGSYYLATGGITKMFNANQNENVALYKNNSGGVFATKFDPQTKVEVYVRPIGSSSWGSVWAIFEPYRTTLDSVLCDFANYDYFFKMSYVSPL